MELEQEAYSTIQRHPIINSVVRVETASTPRGFNEPFNDCLQVEVPLHPRGLEPCNDWIRPEVPLEPRVREPSKDSID